MNSEQRAIIALAKKEGVSPIEKDARLIVHGMVNATRDQMRKHQVGYDKMGQAQQDCVLAELTEAYEELAITIARALASGGTPFVVATCKKLEVSNGQFTATIKSDQAHYNDAISKVQDKGEVLIVFYERQFRDAMDDIQSDKDQKSLPLDSDEQGGASQEKPKKPRAASGAKAAGGIAKAIELPQKLIDDVRAFILDQQNCKTSAIQNFAKCNVGKAEALRKHFEAEGLIEFVGTDASGDYELVRAKASHKPRTIVHKDGEEITTTDGSNPFDGLDDAQDWTEILCGEPVNPGDSMPVEITELTDDLYASIVAKTTEKGQATAGALAVTFDISFEIAEQAFDRMELEGVIDAEGNLAESETFPVMD